MRKNTGKLWYLAWEDHQEDGREVSHHCGKEESPSLGLIFTVSHKHLLKAVTSTTIHVVFNKKADQE